MGNMQPQHQQISQPCHRTSHVNTIGLTHWSNPIFKNDHKSITQLPQQRILF